MSLVMGLDGLVHATWEDGISEREVRRAIEETHGWTKMKMVRKYPDETSALYKRWDE